jgi:hypothetical protein
MRAKLAKVGDNDYRFTDWVWDEPDTNLLEPICQQAGALVIDQIRESLSVSLSSHDDGSVVLSLSALDDWGLSLGEVSLTDEFEQWADDYDDEAHTQAVVDALRSWADKIEASIRRDV